MVPRPQPRSLLVLHTTRVRSYNKHRHACRSNSHLMGDAGIGIAFASAWNASYERRPGADGKLFGAEDGALWRDTAGKSRDGHSESSAAAHSSNDRGQGITTCLFTTFPAATTPAATVASGATHTQNRGWSGRTAPSRRTLPAYRLSRPAPSSCETQALPFCAPPATAADNFDRRVPAAQIPARAAEASARQRRRASRAVERRVALPQGGRRGRQPRRRAGLPVLHGLHADRLLGNPDELSGSTAHV